MKKIVLKIETCLDCPHHKVMPDPDLKDSFCRDDEKIVCTKKNRDVAVAIRPYNLRKEATIPKWCPLEGEAGS